MTRQSGDPIRHFDQLTPDIVLDTVEEGLSTRTTSLCRPLASYVNRVFEVELDDGRFVVIKFFRPGRWSLEALLDEQIFVRELAEGELPVIPPMELAEGGTLGDVRGIRYAIYPRRLGRRVDELDYEQWEEVGRLLGRVHTIGALHPPVDRVTMAPDRSSREHLEYILASGLLPNDLRGAYERAAEAAIVAMLPLWEGIEMIRIHGDCHYGNIVHRPGEPLHLIDFDDMAVGPPIQDLWMLLPGHATQSVAEIETFIEGYETFRTFDRRSIRLIESLRAMRYIHYTAWCAIQARDGGNCRAVADFASESYWRGAIRDLEMQREEILLSQGADYGVSNR